MPSHSNPLAAGKLPAKLLATFLSRHSVANDASVLVPPAPGHDAAVVRCGSDIIVKSDPVTFSTASPAAYLVAVNANDIACLGGLPRWLTVTALFPEGITTEADVSDVFDQLVAACGRIDVSLIGGHTEITPGVDRMLLAGTMIGTPGELGILTPGGANAGDTIYLTEAAGLEGTSIMATEIPASQLGDLSPGELESARGLIDVPGISVVRAARTARAIDKVTAMHDPTEGGVATAIHELADAANLGFEVDLDRIPILPVTRRLTHHFSVSPFGLLSSGALLFTASPGAEPEIASAFSEINVPVTAIGTMRPDLRQRSARSGGAESDLPRYDADEITRVFASS